MDDRSWECDDGTMEFRLTYAGPLLASNTGERDTRPARKEYKRGVRKKFHSQLKRLWEIVPHLKAGRSVRGTVWIEDGQEDLSYDVATIAAKHSHYGWNFVPLVTEQLELSCWIDILYLRRQAPGALLSSGDIDNRLKTLFDCLQVPDANQGYEAISPADDEKPLFCLLENDRLISKVSVETDTLLQDLCTPYDENDVRLVLTIRVKPFNMNLLNLQFG